MKGSQVKQPLTSTVYCPVRLLVLNGLRTASYTSSSGNGSRGPSGVGLCDWAMPAVAEMVNASARTAKRERFIARVDAICGKHQPERRGGDEPLKVRRYALPVPRNSARIAACSPGGSTRGSVTGRRLIGIPRPPLQLEACAASRPTGATLETKNAVRSGCNEIEATHAHAASVARRRSNAQLPHMLSRPEKGPPGSRRASKVPPTVSGQNE